jgi:hypothetical protein
MLSGWRAFEYKGDQRMLDWLKRYWPALIASAFLIAILDGMISSAITCHPVGADASHGTNAQQNQQCTAVAGPVLTTLAAIVGFLDSHGEAVAAFFTIVLAAFTGRLWFSTEKLWSVTNKSVDLARDDFNATHRPWIPITVATFHSGFNWAQGTAVVVISIGCTNSGNSPARRVSLAARIFPFLLNEDIPREIASLQAEHRSDTVRRDVIERTLFPGRGGLELRRALIIPEAKLANLKDGLGDPATEMVPVIVGSIEYYFSFGDPVPHYTPFVYHLWRTDPLGEARITIKLDRGNVDKSELILVPLINAGDPT